MFGLDVDTLRKVREAIAHDPHIEKVLIYGSRAMGNYRRGSDIDITLIGKNLSRSCTVYALQDRLEELYLPYTFDISVFKQLNEPGFIAHILRRGKTFYKKENAVEWEQTTIGEVCEVIAGQSPKGSSYNVTGDGMPFYQGKREFGDKYLGPPVKWTTQVTQVTVAGDILMSVRAPVGPINFATEQVCIGRGLAAIRVKEQIDRDFLFYLLLSMQEKIKGTEGAVFASINKQQIESIQFNNPPLAEQKRIVTILDDAFAAMETATVNTEKNIANARELFQSLLARAFAGGERLKTMPLAQCIRNVDVPKKIPRKQFEDAGRFPIVSQEKELINGYWSDQSDVIRIKSPLVVFGDHTQVLKYVDFDFVFGADGMKILNPKPFLEPKYFYYFLLGHPVDSLGYARHYRLLKKIEIVFPKSLTEQKRIVATLDRISTHTESLVNIGKQKLTLLAELKQSLLQQAFTGELTGEPKRAQKVTSGPRPRTPQANRRRKTS